MTQYDNTNSGSIFKNDKGENEKRPDFKGSINIEGKEYWISGWKRVAGENSKRAGETFISLKAEAKEQSAPAPKPAAQSLDDIDF